MKDQLCFQSTLSKRERQFGAGFATSLPVNAYKRKSPLVLSRKNSDLLVESGRDLSVPRKTGPARAGAGRIASEVRKIGT